MQQSRHTIPCYIWHSDTRQASAIECRPVLITLSCEISGKTYYDRKNSLILSARLIDTPDTPLETIELSLTDGHILQCYGSHNQEPQYHNEIISLVNRHSHLILAA